MRQELHRSQEGVLLRLIAHTEVFFSVVLVVLILLVEFGFRITRASAEPGVEIQSVIESARDGLGVLLGLLLGFSLPMSLPRYEHRTQLVTDEANAIATVERRA
jgi:fumarate reductase subunit D